mmetsp:Transcript_1485/g.1602  ORF Transcript_1485/g.1602 Transcript_1485/m.1602 type:complete len:185 (-) Transcript_1485:41-595(-)
MKLNQIPILVFSFYIHSNNQACYGCGDNETTDFYSFSGTPSRSLLTESLFNISTYEQDSFGDAIGCKDEPCKITYGNASDFTSLCEAKNGTVYTASTGFGCKQESSFAGFSKGTQFFVDNMPACISKSCKSNEDRSAEFDIIVNSIYVGFYSGQCQTAFSSASTFDFRAASFFAILSSVGIMVL